MYTGGLKNISSILDGKTTHYTEGRSHGKSHGKASLLSAHVWSCSEDRWFKEVIRYRT